MLFVCLAVTSGAYASTIRGDLTNDGLVTFEDFVFLRAWIDMRNADVTNPTITEVLNQARTKVPTLTVAPTDLPTNDRCDFDGNATINLADLAILAAWIQTVRSNDATLVRNVAQEYQAAAGQIVQMPGSTMGGGSTGTGTGVSTGTGMGTGVGTGGGTGTGTGMGTSTNGTVGTWSTPLPVVTSLAVICLSNYGTISPSALTAQVTYFDGQTRNYQYSGISGAELRLGYTGTDFMDQAAGLIRFNTALPNGTTIWFKQDGAQVGVKMVVSGGALVPESTSSTATGTGTSSNTGGSTGTGTGTGTATGGVSTVSLSSTASGLNCQNTLIRIRGVSTGFSTSCALQTSGGAKTWTKSAALSHPANDPTMCVLSMSGLDFSTVNPFSSLTFSTPVPGGTVVEIYNSDTGVVVASTVVIDIQTQESVR